ncbi:MAG: hypothetical protein GWN99_02615 [Gemmatimonadetes bacterium]|uniref:Mannosylglycerate hydrolase MGH1-like glycoside hydrolase domain-containing protein n=1 Tax=Candidatus Kutchimonas denitrificans TaxID=3056748 RepID=A0AAE4Z8C2_9BACT|nr:hypothetical protein [Gemmatimonadota bacterium]NIR74848.1 hypothetical protein [Candidatus Kutchimonas denitrificans]NIR99959.1 hypothetical protein [Gemmatimonadota bacterium]NIT65543.1 hypothetical protein [Gemmatimonadota bacterium]NIU52513.1 hypothetical protein [Gemmatimonadota bacterium]
MLRTTLLALVPMAMMPWTGVDVRAQGVPKFDIEVSSIQLEGIARPGVYLGGVGREAAFFGAETGAFEAWAWPVKLLHDFELSFKIPDYSEPIPGASVARRVIVRPELQTVVYSHATFTVKQHILVPLHEPGVIVLLDVDAVRPLEIVASFHADLDLMWPAGIGGQYAFWWADRNRFLLSESRREYNGYVGSPFAHEGSTHPAHAAPDAPSVFRVTVDDEVVSSRFIPIVIAGGVMPRDSLELIYERLLGDAEAYYKERLEHGRHLREDLASVQTPDTILDLALEWAKVNLDGSLACNPDLGCGMVAGYGPSGRGRRPGFGWFFGGDASINALGITPYGDFDLVRAGLDFQRRNRRDDGKMPHEVTQSAMRTRKDWFTEFPYAYYHADTTPYWLVALWSYWLQSADTAFVRDSWEGVRAAYDWCVEHDSDGDRIVDNTAGGLGAIEVGGLGESLHQDIYLAAVSVQSLRAVSELAGALGASELAAEADRYYEEARTNFQREYYVEDLDAYAFGILQGGHTNPAMTVWPATAGSFGLLEPRHARRNLDAFASHRMATDWGTRILSSEHELYDPLHYNNGAVWGFVTGFAGWALFNYDRPHAGFAALWANARSTFYDALGRNPELQSGAFRRTLDTTVPHQFFATSMIPTPLLRGLFGLEADAPRATLAFAPRLPADWNWAKVRNYPVGEDRVDIEIYSNVRLRTDADGDTARLFQANFRPGKQDSRLRVRFAPRLPPGSEVVRIEVDREAVEFEQSRGRHATGVSLDAIEATHGASVDVWYRPGVAVAPRRPRPLEGEASDDVRIIDYSYDGEDGVYTLRVEGRAGRTYTIQLISTADAPRDVRGAQLSEAGAGRYILTVAIDEDAGWHAREIRFRKP